MAALSSPPLFQTPCRSCPLIAKPDAVTNSAYRILVSSRLLCNLVQLSQSFGSVRVIWQLTNTKSLEGQTDPFPESPHHAASALYAISAHCEHKRVRNPSGAFRFYTNASGRAILDYAFNICAVIEEDLCCLRASNTRFQFSTKHGSPSKAKTLCYKANKVLVKILLRISIARELGALGHDVKQVPPAYAKPFRQM